MAPNFFTKALANVEYADVKELQHEKQPETYRFDVKGPQIFHASSKDWKRELAKDICAFANSYGGYLLIGATERDGVLDTLPGCDKQPSFDQTIKNVSFDYIYPPMQLLQTRELECSDQPDKYFYVIRVEPSKAAPHFIHRDRLGCYIRVQDHKRQVITTAQANLEEILLLYRRRESMENELSRVAQRAEKRAATFLRWLPVPGDNSREHPDRPVLFASASPEFIYEPFVRPDEIRDRALKAEKQGFHGYVLLSRDAPRCTYGHSDGLTFHQYPNDELEEYLDFSVYGQLLHASSVSTTGNNMYLDGQRLAINAGAFCQFYHYWMVHLGYSGIVRLSFAALIPVGCKASRYLFNRPGTSEPMEWKLRERVSWSDSFPAESWVEASLSSLTQFLKLLEFAFGRPDSVIVEVDVSKIANDPGALKIWNTTL